MDVLFWNPTSSIPKQAWPAANRANTEIVKTGFLTEKKERISATVIPKTIAMICIVRGVLETILSFESPTVNKRLPKKNESSSGTRKRRGGNRKEIHLYCRRKYKAPGAVRSYLAIPSRSSVRLPIWGCSRSLIGTLKEISLLFQVGFFYAEPAINFLPT